MTEISQLKSVLTQSKYFKGLSIWNECVIDKKGITTFRKAAQSPVVHIELGELTFFKE